MIYKVITWLTNNPPVTESPRGWRASPPAPYPKAIKLIVPDKRVLKLFENYTKAIIQDELDVIHENQRLDSLKEFILPLLMNGQINVDDIEI